MTQKMDVRAESGREEQTCEDPLVSIVIPCHGQTDFLREAIESARKQSHARREIVVVDDGSPHGNVAAVAGEFHDVRYVRQAHAGVSVARNRGVQESRGEFLVFLDADDLLFPNALEDGVRALRAHPECAFVYGRCATVDREGVPLPSPAVPTVTSDHHAALLRSNFIAIQMVMHRRSAFESVGGFRPGMHMAEDYDLYLRLARRYPVRDHGALVACNRRHPESASNDAGRMLASVMRLLRGEARLVNDPARREACRAGIVGHRDHWGAKLVSQVRSDVSSRRWRPAGTGAATLLRYHPALFGQQIVGAARTRLPWYRESSAAEPDAWQRSGSREQGDRLSGAAALSVLSLFAAVVAFVTWYVRRERFIYFWDFSHYQQRFSRFADTLTAVGPVNAAHALVTSVRWQDYNDLPIAPLAPVALAFGSGRLAYVLSVTLVWALPTVLVVALLARSLARGSAASDGADGVGAGRILSWLLPVAVVALCPQFWLPVLRGYPDVAGLGVLAAAFLLYLRNPLEQQRIWRLVVLGCLLGGAVLLRRWYAYAVVGFFVAAVAREAMLLWNHWRRERAGAVVRARQVAARLAVVGVIAVAFVFAAAGPQAVKMATTNYSVIYSGYQLSQGAFEKLRTLVDYFGALGLAVVVAALVAAARRQRGDLALFFGLHLAVTYVLFRRTQAFDIHHYYSLLLSALPLVGMLVVNWSARLRSATARVAFASAVLGFGAINFMVVLVPAVGAAVPRDTVVLPAAREGPLRRGDLPAIASLLRRLDHLTAGSSDSIYVVASGLTFNDAVLRNAPSALGDDVAEVAGRVLGTSHIDMRDGFPNNFVRAQYAVATRPVEYHRPPEAQQDVGLLASQLFERRGVGRSFQRLPGTVTLGDGATVYLFEKVRPFDVADVEALGRELGAGHPAYASLFTPSDVALADALREPVAAPKARDPDDGSAP